MSKRTSTDPQYLTKVQYKDASKLNARIQLHKRFSVNKYDWQQWVFDRLRVPVSGHLLEIGCGSGQLWTSNRDRIPAGWQIVLSDLSTGMIQEVRANLKGGRNQLSFTGLDIQALPFEGGVFDVVVANHMLYHVPDRRRALSEVHRVLKQGGRFYAATNGQRSMVALFELMERFDPSVEQDHAPAVMAASFDLETGKDQLLQVFSQAVLHRYEDALVVTEVEPLADYAFSMGRFQAIRERRTEFIKFLERELAVQGGAIHIEKATGLFEAYNDIE
ncbi:MAG: methyltransferase domain-containing protein [Candidatus Latescibacteria bacterium]|nr:methyltransferase domain-containing protein [Candidatus Latescibacterota bacterium]